MESAHKMEKKWMITIGIIVIIIFGGLGYYLYSSHSRAVLQNSFSMDKANSFFAQKNATATAIIKFCNENKKECLHYCENVNRSNGFCKVLGLGNFKVANVTTSN